MDRLSLELQHYFFVEERSTHVTLADVLKIGGERLFGLVFAVLGLMLAFPFPLSVRAIPGCIILGWALQLAVGAKSPWLPKGLVHKPIAIEALRGVMKQGIAGLRVLEMFSCPRLLYICTSFRGRFAIGVILAIASILIMLRLPGLNTLAGIGILFTGWGLLVDDGAICLTGLAVCILANLIGVFSAIAIFVWGSGGLGCPATY